MNVNIDTNIKEFKKRLHRFEKKAMPQALRHTVSDLAKELAMKEMRKVVDDTFEGGATSWTKRAFGYVKAKKGKRPVSKLFIKDSQAEYLQYQIDGGTRLPKGRSMIIPSKNASTNKHGNFSRDKYRKIKNNQGYFGENDKIYKKRGKKSVTLEALYIKKATYKPKFKYFEVAERFVQRRFDSVIRANLSKAIKRMK